MANYGNDSAAGGGGPVERQPAFVGWCRDGRFWRVVCVGGDYFDVLMQTQTRRPRTEVCVRPRGEVPGPVAPAGQ